MEERREKKKVKKIRQKKRKEMKGRNKDIEEKGRRGGGESR